MPKDSQVFSTFIQKTKAGMLAVCLILLAVATPQGLAVAQSNGQSNGQSKVAAQPDLGVQDYVLGNTLMTLYHEFGHAVVTELDLPVLGREEDAVDNFSIVTVAQKLGDIDAYGEDQALQLDDYLWATADAWLAYSESSEEDDQAYASEHALDLQRFFNHVCLVYGSDVELHSNIGKEFDVAPDLLEDCEARYGQAYFAWQDIIAENIGESEIEEGEIEIEFKSPDNADHKKYVDWLEQWDWLQDFEETMEMLIPLPDPISVVFGPCGEANAYWDPEGRTIQFCYELMATYERFFGE